jgi:hypothetical protein
MSSLEILLMAPVGHVLMQFMQKMHFFQSRTGVPKLGIPPEMPAGWRASTGHTSIHW